MTRSRLTQDQIIEILKVHQGYVSAVDLCHRQGVSDATFYTWRSKYGGMEVSEALRLKALEDDNVWLKWPLAKRGNGCLDAGESTGKKLVTPGLRRNAATWANYGAGLRNAVRVA